jgi:hypoxanthine-DNA glycosylase
LGRACAFLPVADSRASVLILGSLPGAESLRRGEYYAHPRNAFWRLVGAVIGRELAPLPYGERVAALRDAGLAVSDVIASASRRGSLDAAIRDPATADVEALVAQLPALSAVAFNGATAARLGRRQLSGLGGSIVLIDLPSSSPAFAAMPYDEKLRRWTALARYLP